MRTDNLSKELCEICGIKPLYKVMLNGIMLDITDDKKLAEISVFKRGGVMVDTYPDFEQPENFVKLFNMPLNNDCKSIGGLITGSTKSVISTDDFLEKLLRELKYNSNSANIKDAIQAIRETEWVYG